MPAVSGRPSSRTTSRYSARDSHPVGRARPKLSWGRGENPSGVGQGQGGPSQGPLPHPGHVPLAGEADLAELGEAESNAHLSLSPLRPEPPASRRPEGRSGTGWRRRKKSYRHLASGREILPGALAPTGRRDRRGHHVLDPEPGAGPAVVAGCPAAVRQSVAGQGVEPVLPQEVTVEAGRQVVPGQRLVLGAVAVDGGLERHPLVSEGIGPTDRGRSTRTTPGRCRPCATPVQ